MRTVGPVIVTFTYSPWRFNRSVKIRMGKRKITVTSNSETIEYAVNAYIKLWRALTLLETEGKTKTMKRHIEKYLATLFRKGTESNIVRLCKLL